MHGIWTVDVTCFFKWANPGLFFFSFTLFNTVDSKLVIYSLPMTGFEMPLYQLRHNHCPRMSHMLVMLITAYPNLLSTRRNIFRPCIWSRHLDSDCFRIIWSFLNVVRVVDWAVVGSTCDDRIGVVVAGSVMHVGYNLRCCKEKNFLINGSFKVNNRYFD